uniref:Arginine kinase n=1 Tax=Palpitomonas bilix TaxID=652834 RepID=A0A7S3G149_9EUKA
MEQRSMQLSEDWFHATMFSRVFSRAFRSIAQNSSLRLAAAGASGAAAAVAAPVAFADEGSLRGLLSSINKRLENIERSIGTEEHAALSFPAEADFPHFSDENKSLVKKYLTPAIYARLREKTTKWGFTIDRAIQSAVDNPKSSVGIYAGDEDSYVQFADIFDPIIDDYHGGYDKNGKHKRNLNAKDIPAENVDPRGDFVVSTRIRVGRNLSGLPLPAGTTRAARREVEKRVVSALNSLEGDLKGRYYPLGNMSDADRKQLILDHFLFKGGDKYLNSAGCERDWPESRGIFHSADKRFLVWVNEEDEIRIISMQKGADIRMVFDRLSRAIQSLETRLEFAYNDHHGYIASCPTNLGTAMRASVHIKIPKASKSKQFKALLDRYHLQARGIHGEHSASEGGVFDISNRRRLGLSEVDCVMDMYSGVKALIALEKAL